MFALTSPAQFRLITHNIEHDLQVLSFTGRESISSPFAFDVELVSERPDLDIESLLHKPAFLTFNNSGAGIHGQIYRMAQGDSGKRLSHYNLTLVPGLAYLAHRINQRIFQQLSVPQIIAQVLEEHGIQSDAYHFRFRQPYPEREYCVQYAESDLFFIQRLCWEEGIHFHFRHTQQGHLLVFGEDQTVFPRMDKPTAYVQDSGLIADEAVISRFQLRYEARSSRTTQRDYNFERSRSLLQVDYKPPTSGPQPDLEHYQYPGRFKHAEQTFEPTAPGKSPGRLPPRRR